MQICDSHLHIGQFRDKYFGFEELNEIISDCNIAQFIISSTSTCGYEFKLVYEELSKIKLAYNDNAFLYYWVLPELVRDNSFFYFTDLPYSGLKLHTFAQEWSDNELLNVFQIAFNKNLPILIHTGVDSNCSANRFEKFLKKFPKAKVILAHGLLTDASIKLISEYENVYVDTAFMEIENIQIFIENGLYDKVIYGSDMPINKIFYENLSHQNYFNNRFESIKSIADEIIFKNLMSENFKTFYS